ncbi:hypothetical protein F2P81_003431 [Scophthalmus maximus]|uniref:Uncharacterized protein n=1 Tax=Scophthalmus maximus TaxID=52904 RepID=A0A6A4TE70_SCOMX|nr:hypothetical protein F2P81_003431 [Scophthalmus maximus]
MSVPFRSCLSIIETNRWVNVSFGMDSDFEYDNRNESMMDNPPLRWHNLTFQPPFSVGWYGFVRGDKSAAHRRFEGKASIDFHSPSEMWRRSESDYCVSTSGHCEKRVTFGLSNHQEHE